MCLGLCLVAELVLLGTPPTGSRGAPLLRRGCSLSLRRPSILLGESVGRRWPQGSGSAVLSPPVWMRRRVETSGLCSDFQKGLETRWGWVSWELC